MFEDIDETIKTLSEIIFWLSLIIGGLWILVAFSFYQESGDAIYKSHMIYSVILIVWGIISSYFIYGFGEIINHLKRIDYKMNGNLILDKEEINVIDKSYEEEIKYDVRIESKEEAKYDAEVSEEDMVTNEEIIAELEKDLEDEF